MAPESLRVQQEQRVLALKDQIVRSIVSEGKPIPVVAKKDFPDGFSLNVYPNGDWSVGLPVAGGYSFQQPTLDRILGEYAYVSREPYRKLQKQASLNVPPTEMSIGVALEVYREQVSERVRYVEAHKAELLPEFITRLEVVCQKLQSH